MPHIQSFYKALKMSWLHKLLDTFNHSQKFYDKCLSGRSCSWQLRLEPSHIASVLSRLTLSPAHYENVLSIYIWNIPSKAWHIYIYKIKKMNKKINKIKHTHPF
jgi:hypothetical protein